MRSYGLKPRLIVIAFLDEVIARADVEQDEDTGDKAETRLRVGPIYRDYAEYAEDYFQAEYGMGYFEESAEETVQNGLPVRCLQLRCEAISGPKIQVLTWVFETELGAVAVQLECFADKFDKYEKDFLKVVKSFRPIERTQSLGLDSSTGSFLSFFALDELSPEDRTLRRKEQERQEWAKLSADMPAGWKALEIDGVHVLTHADEKHAAKVVELVNAVRQWLDQTFPEVGKGEYTRTPIVRICKDNDEAGLMLSGTGGIGSSTLTTFKDSYGGSESSQWGVVAQVTMMLWFQDKDPMLWIYMPAWLRTGLMSVMRAAEVKGKKLEFNADYWAELVKTYLLEPGSDQTVAARSLMTIPLKEFLESAQLQYDSMCLVRLLVTTRSKKHKQVLPSYLASLDGVLTEILAERRGELSAENRETPKNEAEEELFFEEEKKRAEERSGRLREETLSRAFAGWTEGDWKDFETEFTKSK
jgi:hypothetical protein